MFSGAATINVTTTYSEESNTMSNTMEYEIRHIFGVEFTSKPFLKGDILLKDVKNMIFLFCF